MLGAVFEFERDLLIERTKASIVRSPAEGMALGRPSALTKAQRGDAVGHLAAGSLSPRWPDFGTTSQPSCGCGQDTPRHQAGDQADSQLQILLIRRLRSRRRRAHAHRPQGPVAIDSAATMSFADQFYALAGQVRPV